MISVVDTTNFFVLKLKKFRKYNFPKGFLGLNLGCEYFTTPEYIGVDGSFLIFIENLKLLPPSIKKQFFKKSCTSKWLSYNEFSSKLKPLSIIHHNLLLKIPFKNNSVPNIFSSHFLEHLSEEDGINLLKSCYNVLIPGGRIRICVPLIEEEIENIQKSIKDYQNGDSGPIQKFITSNTQNQNSFSVHRRMYSYKDLSLILKDIGFREIQKVKFHQGKLPKLKELESREGLIIEAIK